MIAALLRADVPNLISTKIAPWVLIPDFRERLILDVNFAVASGTSQSKTCIQLCQRYVLEASTTQQIGGVRVELAYPGLSIIDRGTLLDGINAPLLAQCKNLDR